MNRRTAALALFIAAVVCFGVALAAVIGSDFDANAEAWALGGFLATALALVTERLHG